MVQAKKVEEAESSEKVMSFSELQQRMRVSKSKRGNGYDYRDTAQIIDQFKLLNSGWIIELSSEVQEVGRPLVKEVTTVSADGSRTINKIELPSIFVITTATASCNEEKHTAKASAYMGENPLSNKGNKMQNDPQWSGTTDSYATKRALEKLFLLGSQDADSCSMATEMNAEQIEAHELGEKLTALMQEMVNSGQLKATEASKIWNTQIALNDVKAMKETIKKLEVKS